ncbi:MAG: conserved exported protein of unknown function [Nitrospira sp.]|nr:MAG: conserved exported protein of unknown function [Nitrospira sp.]
MKFTTLRNVTLALLFALLADAAYAGSSGPSPAQRENRRDNNDDQEQQGRPTPRGGVQVLPQEHGGVDLDQFNRRPGNQQNRNEADADTRNNQGARPTIPTDGDPAAGLVPNAGPAAGNTNGPAAQPNQGKVRQLQQQLNLEQKVGKTPQAQPRQLGDANQQAAPPPQNRNEGNVDTRNNPVAGSAVQPHQGQGQQQRIQQLPNANQPPTPQGLGVGNQGATPQNLQDRNRANADARNHPIGGPAAQPPNATPAQVSTDIFDPYTKPTIQYEGDVLFDENEPYLAEDGTLNGRLVGEYLAGGATSRVHKSSDPKLVKKIISLNWANAEKAGATITEQNVGRTMLQGLQLATHSTLFRVAERHEQAVISARNDKKEYRFVFNREDNIASEVYERYAGESNPKGKAPLPIKDASGQPITVSNAEKRAEKRDQARKGKNENDDASPLTDLEELTINLIIRTLNDNGLVWTDHKLANLDIVRNEHSPTGYQVVFFDFDGFRRVKGSTEAVQAEAARDIQKAFDNPALPNLNIPRDRGWNMMDNRVKQAYRKHYSDECKEIEAKGGNIPLDLGFNKTAFQGQPVRTLASPPANLNRSNYLYFNGLSEQAFKDTVATINDRYKLKIEFSPNNPIKSITIPTLRDVQP